ncbi:hypothetical protein ACUN7Z_00760 [Vreelandella venusta]|uniref:hypothetical protein n=1 Tax=Vreelandella venusta TaxID=44935 RepID=UPI004044FC5E
MDINDIKHLAVERIYLIPDASEGQLGYVWGDDPAPGEGMDASEAVEYVRKDVHDARIAELERERDMHKAAEEAQIALRQKADEREATLAAHVERLRELLAMCRHHACYSIGDSEALAMQLASIRNVANEALRVEPEISLARRDLIKQAEALEEICSCGELLSNRDILGMAQGLRQQADAL